MPFEEGPGHLVVLVCHQYPHPPLFLPIPPAIPPARRHTGDAPGYLTHRAAAAAFILLPYHAEEKGPGGAHDGDVGEGPVAVVGDEGFDDEEEEGVALCGAHCVVGDAGGVCAADPGGVGEEGVEAAVATLDEEGGLARDFRKEGGLQG